MAQDLVEEEDDDWSLAEHIQDTLDNPELASMKIQGIDGDGEGRVDSRAPRPKETGKYPASLTSQLQSHEFGLYVIR